MAITVVDNTNLAQMLSEQSGETVELTPAAAPGDKATPAGDKPVADKPAVDAADPEKKDVDPAANEHDDADDEEGEDGLTARQKRELSAKMLKAIGKKHRQVKEAEEFAADQIRVRREAEARAAEAEARASRLEAQNRPAPAKEEVEPARQDFATETEYIDAKIKWGVDQGIKQREAARIAEQRQASVQAQFARAAELVPDFEQVTNKLPPLPGAVVTYLQESEMFAELGYHLAKNPDAAAKLANLSPVRQLVELGKIEAKLAPFGSTKTPEPGDKPTNSDGKPSQAAPSTVDTGLSPSKARSNAPVIKPLSSSDGQQVSADVRDMTTRQMIDNFQRSKGVNLHVRKRH